MEVGILFYFILFFGKACQCFFPIYTWWVSKIPTGYHRKKKIIESLNP